MKQEKDRIIIVAGDFNLNRKEMIDLCESMGLFIN